MCIWILLYISRCVWIAFTNSCNSVKCDWHHSWNSNAKWFITIENISICCFVAKWQRTNDIKSEEKKRKQLFLTKESCGALYLWLFDPIVNNQFAIEKWHIFSTDLHQRNRLIGINWISRRRAFLKRNQNVRICFFFFWFCFSFQCSH